MSGRWECRQLDVLRALDRELEEAFGSQFAALDVAELLQDPERLRRLISPFMPVDAS